MLKSDKEEVTRGYGYPRPQLQRAEWVSLNGEWEFAFDREGRWRLPSQVAFDRTILVPYSPETPASGIGDTGFFKVCWYRKTFDTPELKGGQRLMLHFGAVD